MNVWLFCVNIGAILCVLATGASALKSIWCFPIWIIANILLGAYDLNTCLTGDPVWGRVILDVLQFAISIFGWINWKRIDNKKEAK